MKQQLLFSLMALLPMLASAQDDDVTINGIFYYLDDYTPYGGDIYTTAIDKVVNRSSANRQSYDLQGRQLALPQKGIIICNGKKYLKK